MVAKKKTLSPPIEMEFICHGGNFQHNILFTSAINTLCMMEPKKEACFEQYVLLIAATPKTHAVAS